MSDELKPCPHCGNSDHLMVKQVEGETVSPNNFQVVCSWMLGGCGASGGVRRTEVEAIAAWNARADDADELPTDDACAILRKNLYDVGDLGRAMGILEPNELVGGSGDRAYIFERLADLIERDYVRRDSIDDKDMDMSECVHMCPNEGTTADEPKVITNAEKYKLDTREKLEADIAMYYVIGIPSVNNIFEWLDRQAAITERECMSRDTSERVGWDCAECAEGLGKELDVRCDPLKERIAELTAELETYRKHAEQGERMIPQSKENGDTREKLEADIRAWHRDTPFATKPSVQTLLGLLDRQAAITEREVEHDLMLAGRMAVEVERKRIAELTAERDQLQEQHGRQVKTIERLTAERELYRDNMIAQTKRVAELTAERDELKERVARFDSISNIDGIANLLVQFEDLTAERDQLQADLDACRMREKAAEDYDFREAAERWEQAFEDKCCEVVRLTAERDELKEQRRKAAMKIMRMEDERKRLDERMMEQAGKHQGYLQRIVELTAERDRLQKVVQVQADSFRKMEAELKEANDTCNTLRASVAGLKETVERFKARDGA